VIGLPIGSYPESRPPQAKLPEQARIDIRAAYQRFGLIDD
jgi:4-hydroxy-tetrahydrodipicolinate synthase